MLLSPDMVWASRSPSVFHVISTRLLAQRSSSCFHLPSTPQVQAQQARQAIFSNSSLPGAGSQMGDVASVFEAIAARCPQEGSPIWPDNFNDQQNRVVRTRREFGLDWRYANSCPVSNHSNLEIAPDQTAALRDATVITIPNGTATTFHHKVQEFFSSGQASDLSIPGTSLCPFCAAGLSRHCAIGLCYHGLSTQHLTGCSSALLKYSEGCMVGPCRHRRPCPWGRRFPW